ncbi:hypothetical protein [Streptomyces sp. Ag109_G2-15]|uniref:hypothetical protein n=1 Tax=Streptomyces sp. Ag109_G2-15 TaxID=1938850 RepID=UPI000BD030A5|nr:hypothetical protein [Streptomyces sp. Ag109_G2-15]SOD87703.1 hypothetical protein SAMN06272765_5195 [Streptomyces sp. Ag109_G2-15]
MATLTPPRAIGSRAGATVVLTALAAAGASWVAAPPASAAGENGDIRVHRVGVPYGVSKDDSAVCKFYLDAVNFDVLPGIGYTITPQPPLPTAATVAGTIQLAGGAGHTDPLGLADGQYKITWVVSGATKEKVFRVNCRDEKKDEKKDGEHGPGQIEDHQQGDKQGDKQGDQQSDQRSDAAWGQGGGDHSDGPKGGVHAGGGGMVDTSGAFSPVAAAAAVGLVAVSGVAYLRLIRRRPHGAA